MKKVVLKSVMISRDGKRVSPPIGKAFAFTKEEVEAIKEANPSAIRDAVNEDQEADMAEVIALSNTNTRLNVKNVKPGAGKTTAMVDGADGAPATGDEGGETLTVKQIKEGLADLDNDALTAALNAEREGANRPTAVAAYEAEIEKRNAPIDDL